MREKLNTNGSDSNGLLAIRGYSTKIKPDAGAVLLNVNTLTNVFYEPKLLSEYLKGAMGSSDSSKVRAHLTGLRISINFKRSPANNNDLEMDTASRRVKTLASVGRTPEHETVEDTSDNVWKHLSTKYPEACLETDKKLWIGNVGKAASPKNFYLASGQPASRSFRPNVST